MRTEGRKLCHIKWNDILMSESVMVYAFGNTTSHLCRNPRGSIYRLITLSIVCLIESHYTVPKGTEKTV